jgi:hypothetical protein
MILLTVAILEDAEVVIWGFLSAFGLGLSVWSIAMVVGWVRRLIDYA